MRYADDIFGRLTASVSQKLRLISILVLAVSGYFHGTARGQSLPPFTEMPGVLASNTGGDFSWGDYDSDGDLDIVASGSVYGTMTTLLQNNGAGVYSEIATSLPSGLDSSAVSWGDYDSDNDLDILLAGRGEGSGIYRNDGGSFTNIGLVFPAMYWCRNSVAWGDYDSDGDLDILFCGQLQEGFGTPLATIYRNDDGVFTDTSPGFVNGAAGSADWGDYDNDGDLDVAVSGFGASGLYRNDCGIFTLLQPLVALYRAN